MFLGKLKSLRSIALAMCMMVLGGCANAVWTTVSTYRSQAVLPEGQPIRIVPFSKALMRETQQGQAQVDQPKAGATDHQASTFDELEFSFFADALGERLKRLGYPLKEGDAEQLRVYLAYDVVRQRRDAPSSVSAYGHLGYRYGSVLVVDDVDRDQYEFVRKVKIKIVVANGDEDGEALLSMTAVSKGQCGHLASVYSEMLDAMLSDLNRPNGSVIKLKSKRLGPCEVRA